MDKNFPALNSSSTTNVDFKVSPNPAKNILTIDTAAQISKVEIYTTLEQLVNTVTENKKEMEMDWGALNNGIYFLIIITTNNQKSFQRIVKE